MGAARLLRLRGHFGANIRFRKILLDIGN